jgi:hypothetical protein
MNEYLDASKCTIHCPNCHAEMTSHEASIFYKSEPATIGICYPCNLLWFNHSESISLTPHAVLDLFQCIARVATKDRTPLDANFCCPYCANILQVIHDMQHATRFSYWRCQTSHGQLFSFSQFLFEKNFVRSPSPEELAGLRKMVRQISCSQCGGAIDLAVDTVCSHCGSAIALIDPDGIAKAVRDLTVSESKTVPATAAQTQAALILAQLQALSEKNDADNRESHHDLLTIGLAAVSALLSK